MIPDAWGWCTGTIQRDGTGREEGGGFRMGNTCTPVVDSCMAKHVLYNCNMYFTIQYCKVKKKTDTSLCQQVCLVKDMVSQVVMYGCDSWTTEKS